MNNIDWCERALAATRSLWDSSRLSAFRNSHDKSSGDTHFRPTVTCNAIVAFDSFCLFSEPLLKATSTSTIDPSPLLALFHTPNAAADWFTSFRNESTHHDGPRGAIL